MSPTAVKFVLVVLCVSGVLGADDYLAETQRDCNTKSDLLSCGKYEAAKFIVRAANAGPVRTKIVDGLVDFVTIDKPEDAESLFPAARQIPHDSEFRKFVKFVQRQVDAYLGSRALSITLPSQARLVDADVLNNEIVSDTEESRASKKKKVSMLVPLIIILKLFKIKIMLAAVLFGVLFIKKAILFILLLAPSYLQMLKICKMQHHPHPHIEEHDFGNTGYGYAHGGHAAHGSYAAKDWSNSRAYASYKPK